MNIVSGPSHNPFSLPGFPPTSLFKQADTYQVGLPEVSPIEKDPQATLANEPLSPAVILIPLSLFSSLLNFLHSYTIVDYFIVYIRDWQTFSSKDQIVSILGFVGHKVCHNYLTLLS